MVVLSARAENLVSSVSSVLRTHPELDPSRIVVVDDGAQGEARARLPERIGWLPGEKPFVYGRNVNLGVTACTPDATVLMGDDVEVITPGAFDRMGEFLDGHPEVGVLSAGLKGVAGNARQRYSEAAEFVREPASLSFDCVMIRRSVWDTVGVLDARFEGYACESTDLCIRAAAAGYRLGTLNDCAVWHNRSLPSTFRGRPDCNTLFFANVQRLLSKWKGRFSPVLLNGAACAPSPLALLHDAVLSTLERDPQPYDAIMEPLVDRESYAGEAARRRPPSSLARLLYLNAFVRQAKPRTVLELGTGDGASALFMLLGLGSGARLLTVDRSSAFPSLLAPVRSDPRLQTVTGDCLNPRTLERLPIEAVDLLFVDTLPTFTHLRKVLSLYRRRLRKGSLIAWDDIHANREAERFWEFVDQAKLDLGRSFNPNGFGVSQN